MTTVTEHARRVTTHELSSKLRVAVLRLSRRLRAEKADNDLSDGQTTVLGVLAVSGPQTLSSLAEIERVTLPSMNRTVNALVEAGYIEREPSSDDRRKVILHLSASGIELVRETRRRRDEWLYQRLEKLSPSDRRTLADAATILEELSGQ